jgi:hypothetical protein
MFEKEMKSQAELGALIMGEVRKHPDGDSIRGVTITKASEDAPHHPNWTAAFTVDGPRVVPDGAVRLIAELQDEFDCAWP